MGRVIESPVKRWPGKVTLVDPMPFPVFMAWKRAIDAAGEAKKGAAGGEDAPSLTVGEAGGVAEIADAVIPGICACVEKWELRGLPERVTPETFPATPRRSSALLIMWLTAEIGKVVEDEEEIPNA